MTCTHCGAPIAPKASRYRYLARVFCSLAHLADWKASNV